MNILLDEANRFKMLSRKATRPFPHFGFLVGKKMGSPALEPIQITHIHTRARTNTHTHTPLPCQLTPSSAEHPAQMRTVPHCSRRFTFSSAASQSLLCSPSPPLCYCCCWWCCWCCSSGPGWRQRAGSPSRAEPRTAVPTPGPSRLRALRRRTRLKRTFFVCI